MGRPRKCRPRKFIFSRALQHCISLVRAAGLLEGNKFPELIGPVVYIEEEMDSEGEIRKVQKFLVTIRLRDFFQVWLKFNASGSYPQISTNYREWFDLHTFRVPKRFDTTG